MPKTDDGWILDDSLLLTDADWGIINELLNKEDFEEVRKYIREKIQQHIKADGE